jgi:hypothetical protein
LGVTHETPTDPGGSCHCSLFAGAWRSVQPAWSYQGSKGHVFANMARFRRKIWIKMIKLSDFEVITLVFMGKMMIRQ